MMEFLGVLKDFLIELTKEMTAVTVKAATKVASPMAKPVVPDYVKLAQSQINVREVPGPGDNPKIVEYHKATTLKSTDDEVAWCSAFMCWVMQKCGYESSHSAAARSWLGYNKKLKGFKKYAIVVFKRGNSTWQGHVAIAMEDRGATILCLGGNQGDAVSYASYKKEDVLGFFEPVKLKG